MNVRQGRSLQGKYSEFLFKHTSFKAASLFQLIEGCTDLPRVSQHAVLSWKLPTLQGTGGAQPTGYLSRKSHKESLQNEQHHVTAAMHGTLWQQ
jgi:hypothetical protein